MKLLFYTTFNVKNVKIRCVAAQNEFVRCDESPPVSASDEINAELWLDSWDTPTQICETVEQIANQLKD